MKRDIILKGKSVDEKFRSVELILNRMSKRLSKKVVSLMPISPIFHFAYAPGSDGVIARIVFPASGVITKVAFHVDRRGKKPFKVRIDLLNDLEGIEQSKTVLVKHTTEISDVNVNVEAGDRALITYIPLSEEDESIKGIWFSMLYQIGIKHLQTKTYMIEDFERLLNKDIEDVRNY